MTANDRRTLGPAWHRRVNGLHVLKLQGSFYEMGRQHGALLRDAIPRGPLPYYRRYIERLMRRAGLGAAAPLAWRLLHLAVGRRVVAATPEFAREAIRGLADGAGMPHEEVVQACSMPDTLLWLVSRIIQLTGSERAVAHRLALELGCSSAIAWGPATRDGKLLHGRNMDYHGVESWTREPAVIFHEPEEGMRYVSVSAAGVLLGGATAMNEAGLTLAVHQHMFCDATRLGGVPIGIIGDVVMREARSLDDAQRILDAHRHIGCWTYLVADGGRREVLCHEQTPERRTSLRTGPGDSTFRYANIYLDPELGRTERNLYGSYWRANQGRYQRLGERLRDGHGMLDAQGIASILADTGNDECRLHRAIAMLMTVASVVFSPEDGVLWVATGETPVSHNRYEPFDLTREDHAPERGVLEPATDADPAARAAFEAYREAYLLYFDRGDVAGARRVMARAVERAPRQALYHVLLGLLAIAEEDASSALASFDQALALGHPDRERIATFHLWRGRALDLLGRRAEAKASYRAAADAPRSDPAVARAARKGLSRPFTAAKARRVAIEFSYADVVSP
jgi:tetratricopeptide (TPR) repeat protein